MDKIYLLNLSPRPAGSVDGPDGDMGEVKPYPCGLEGAPASHGGARRWSFRQRKAASMWDEERLRCPTVLYKSLDSQVRLKDALNRG